MTDATTLATIQQAFRQHTYRYTLHATEQTTLRQISRQEIEAAIADGEIIEDYPHDKYGPSCLILGRARTGRVLHIQCSLPPIVKIITAYEPDPEEWLDYRTRVKKGETR